MINDLNPHTCAPEDASMSPAEYAEWQRGYEMFLDMRDSQLVAVMQGGEDTTGEPKDFPF